MECLAATAIAFDMGVEQDGLGAGVNMGIFYEVEPNALLPQGNACGAQVGACALAAGHPTVIGCFITMKLECGARYYCASSYYIGSGFVDEQQHWRDKGRQARGQLRRALRRHGARAGGVEHEAHGVHPGGDGGIHVLLAREAADLDARAGGWEMCGRGRGLRAAHGSASYAAVRAGRPQAASYTGPRKYSPSGEKVGAAASRSFLQQMVPDRPHLLQEGAAYVGGHDQDGVLEA